MEHIMYINDDNENNLQGQKAGKWSSLFISSNLPFSQSTE